MALNSCSAQTNHFRPWHQSEVDLDSGLSVQIINDARDLIRSSPYEPTFLVSRTIGLLIPSLITSTYSVQMVPWQYGGTTKKSPWASGPTLFAAFRNNRALHPSLAVALQRRWRASRGLQPTKK